MQGTLGGVFEVRHRLVACFHPFLPRSPRLKIENYEDDAVS
jgi:hypothetical protein